jgi:hypothetical protein
MAATSRYVAENSGAVLDTRTGLREWFNSFREAIEWARRKNGYEA